MKALSIRQPWAWLIMRGYKDIENRNWKTDVRGILMVHASSVMTHGDYEAAYDMAMAINPRILFPSFRSLQLGGIIGLVGIYDCVQQSESLWFEGPFGFVLRNPQPVEFLQYKGRLKFFDVPFMPLI